MIHGSYLIKALAFLLPLVGAWLVFRPRLAFEDQKVFLRFAIYVVGATTIIFTIANTMVMFLALTLLIVCVRPPGSASFSLLYFAFLYVVPADFGWAIPFPGINFLISISQTRLLAFALLPAAIAALRGNAIKLNRTDAVFLAYAVLVTLMTVRTGGSVTNVLRMMLYSVFAFLVPYLALSRSIRQPKDAQLMLCGLIWIGTFLTVVGVGASVQRWDYYTSLASATGHGTSSAFREGTFRISGPIGSMEYGFWMGATVALILLMRRYLVSPKIVTWGWAGVACLMILSSQSRGGLLGSLLLAIIFPYFLMRSSGLRASYVGAGLVGAVALYLSLKATGFDAVDEYGTFDYRQNLLDAAWIHVKQYPILGNPRYMESPIFAHLYQGQGIIDFVNGYVQVVLGSGLVGLGLFVLALLFAWRDVVKGTDIVRDVHAAPDGVLVLGRFLGMALPAFAVLAATTSFVSYMQPSIIALAAFARGYRALAESLRDSPVAEAAPEPVAVTPAAVGEPARPAPRPEDAWWPGGYVPGRTGWPS